MPETDAHEDDVQYDLAGNPMGRRAAPAPPTAAPVPPPPYASPPAYTQPPGARPDPNAALNYASSPRDYVNAPPEAKTPGQMLLGVGVATAVGLLGAVGLEKILFTTHFNITILYILLGSVVAGTLRGFLGRGGQTTCLVALAVMIVCSGVGQLLLVRDVVTRINDSGGIATFSEMLPVVLGGLSVRHWMLVGGGIICCGYIAYKEQ